MIRDRNIDPSADVLDQIIPMQINAGASLAAVAYAAARIPWAHVLVSATFDALVVTDADDSARIDLHREGASILGSTVDPVAADTETELTITGAAAGAADDLYEVVVTTGAGDAIVGTMTLVVRPKAGRERL